MSVSRVSRLAMAAAAASLFAIGAALPAAADGFEHDEYMDDIYADYDDGTLFFPERAGTEIIVEPGYYDDWDDTFYEDLYD